MANLLVSASDKTVMNDYPQTTQLVWTSKIQAWVYPGAPACAAQGEYQDGRSLFILKPEYYKVSPAAAGTLTQRTVASDGCNGYSVANAASIVASCKKAFVVVSCNVVADMDALCSDAGNRATAKATLRQFCLDNGFAGVEIDFELYHNWNSTQYANYQTFMSDLSTELHTYGLQLMIDGPPITTANDSVNGQNLYLFKYEDFVSVADFLVVLAYDKQYDYGAGTPISPTLFVQQVCDWMIAKVVNLAQIVIGMPSYGYHGTTGGFSITIDTKTQSAAFTGYQTAAKDSDYENVWANAGISYDFQDIAGMNLKRQVIEAKGITNISVWHLGGNDWFVGTEIDMSLAAETSPVTDVVSMQIGPPVFLDVESPFVKRLIIH